MWELLLQLMLKFLVTCLGFFQFLILLFFSPNSPFVGTILFACLLACLLVFGARLELRLCVD